MNGDELIARIKRAADICYGSGETSAELFKRADEQERTGFSVSAPFTRLLAQAVALLEDAY